MEPKKMMKMVIMISAMFWVIGFLMQLWAISLEFNEFGPLQEKYWSFSKAQRDDATTGSELNQMLVKIKNFPPTLMTFKLVGIGFILSGIFLLLMGILKALGMMPMRLAEIMGKG